MMSLSFLHSKSLERHLVVREFYPKEKKKSYSSRLLTEEDFTISPFPYHVIVEKCFDYLPESVRAEAKKSDVMDVVVGKGKKKRKIEGMLISHSCLISLIV